MLTAGDHSGARRQLAALRVAQGLAALPALRAWIAWSEGLIQLRSGNFAEANQSFGEAAEIFGALGDSARRASVRALSAECLSDLGQSEEAWRARFEVLAWLGRRPSGSLHNLLLDAAIAAREEGKPYAALTFQTVDLAVARSLASSTRTVEALVWRSKAWTAVGRNREALADLDEALTRVGVLPDPPLRRRLAADIQEARGGMLVQSDPGVAEVALTEAVQLYHDTDYAWKLPSTLHERSRARLAEGDRSGAEGDLETALREFERRDRGLPPEIFRYSHFERAQAIFDDMIQLQVDRGRPDLGLVYSERARRAQLLAGRAAANDEPEAGKDDGPEAAMRSAFRAVPQGTVVVEYAVLGDRLLTWVVSAAGMQFTERPGAGLAARVDAFWSALASSRGDAAEIATSAESLYSTLVAPWIDRLPRGTRLVFAPDRFLYRLAFPALRDPAPAAGFAKTTSSRRRPGCGSLPAWALCQESSEAPPHAPDRRPAVRRDRSRSPTRIARCRRGGARDRRSRS